MVVPGEEGMRWFGFVLEHATLISNTARHL